MSADQKAHPEYVEPYLPRAVLAAPFSRAMETRDFSAFADDNVIDAFYETYDHKWSPSGLEGSLLLSGLPDSRLEFNISRAEFWKENAMKEITISFWVRPEFDVTDVDSFATLVVSFIQREAEKLTMFINDAFWDNNDYYKRL